MVFKGSAALASANSVIFINCVRLNQSGGDKCRLSCQQRLCQSQ